MLALQINVFHFVPAVHVGCGAFYYFFALCSRYGVIFKVLSIIFYCITCMLRYLCHAWCLLCKLMFGITLHVPACYDSFFDTLWCFLFSFLLMAGVCVVENAD